MAENDFDLQKLQEHNRNLEKIALEVAKNRPKEREKRGYISKDNYFLHNLAEKIAKIASKEFGQDISVDDVNLAPVPPKFTADIALRIPVLMKDIKAYNAELLPALQKALNSEKNDLGLTMVELVPPYLNLSLDFSVFGEEIIKSVVDLKNRYGENDDFKGKKVLIEYSSPNVAKSMHVGHLRTTIIGQVLSNVYEKCGYAVFRLNHLGDWGTQFGKVGVAYDLWKDERGELEGQENPVKYLAQLYADFNKEAKENEELNEKARNAFHALENNDVHMLSLWKKFYDCSLVEFEKMYKRMGVYFDSYLGESFYQDKMDKFIEEALEKNIAFKDGNAVVCDLTRNNPESKIPTFLLVKSDGATNYSTRDVAAFYYRKQYFKPDFAIYVVGSEQNLHLKQIFETVRQLGYQNGKEAVHVGFGQIKEGGKKISSRAGAGGLDDLLDFVVNEAYKNMKEEGRDFNEKELREIAEKVGIGALFYNDLQNAPAHNIDFDMERILSMKGKSGPYLQYSIVRGESILRKAGELADVKQINWQKADKLEKIEKDLLKKVAEFPAIIQTACKSCSPHHIAVYLNDLAQIFNHFHSVVHVIKSEGDLKEIRKYLVYISVQTLKNGLNMLNIPIPERM